MGVLTDELALAELAERHRQLYGGPSVDTKLRAIIREGVHTRLTVSDIRHILRTSQSVFFDTHVEAVSGHHTATYLRFESVARSPQLIGWLAGDMAQWIRAAFVNDPITGILATTSAAERLAEGVARVLHDTMRLRVALTLHNGETGRIGTDIVGGAIKPGERFLALNDVTTRGNCVSKLGKVITDNGGLLAGMMVFARRDSGQFPLMKDLTAQHPFYYTTDLDMPQWEPAQCPLCRENKPLLSWKDMPQL
ncbi:MAG: putative Orotate phosphoribosyltransferase (Modular protein) [Nitrospira sp.]